MPDNLYLGEVSGVAVNAQGHVFVFSRGNTTGPAYAAAAAQLLEFGPDGEFVREIGKNLYAWSFAHAVRVDRERQYLGHRQGLGHGDPVQPAGPGHDGVRPQAGSVGRGHRAAEAPEAAAAADRRHVPAGDRHRLGRRPATATSATATSMRAWPRSRRRRMAGSFGSPGDGPGQLNTPHSIAVDAQDHIYVADRGNRRIQVFDTDGKLLRQITIDVPYDPTAKPAIGNKPDQNPPVGTAQDDGRRRALGVVHHAAAEPGAVCVGRLSRPDLQAEAGRQGARRAGRGRQAAEAVRLDPRDRLPVGEHAVCGRAAELAGAEAQPASLNGFAASRGAPSALFPVCLKPPTAEPGIEQG